MSSKNKKKKGSSKLGKYSEKMLAVYRKVTGGKPISGLNKSEHDALLEFVITCSEEGLSVSEIVSILCGDDGPAFLPVVPRNPPAFLDTFQQIAAVPILIAIEMNLPICQETAQFNGLTYSKLHLAYLVSLLDHYRWLKDEIPVLSYDSASIQDFKHASRQKEHIDIFKYIYTWSNTGQNVLDFLGLSAYPEDIPVYKAGRLLPPQPPSNYAHIESQTTNLITDEIVANNFIEYYIEVVTQICGGHDSLVEVMTYESEYKHDTSLWAYNIPTSTDPSSMLSRFADVRHDIPISKSSWWLGLTPMVDPGTVFDNTVRVRYTGYSGVVQYHVRVQNHRVGRGDASIVRPAFHPTDQFFDEFTKSFLLADVDLAEELIGMGNQIDFDDPKFLTNKIKQQPMGLYLFNFLTLIYNRFNSSMAYSMPDRWRTYAGMAYLPNPNYESILLFADLVESIELKGPSKGFRKATKDTPRIDIIPVLYFEIEVAFGKISSNSVADYSDISFEANFTGNFVTSDYQRFFPTGSGIGNCFTRGTLAQNVWYQVENILAPFANVRVMSSFEAFHPDLNDYDKAVLTFVGEPNDVRDTDTMKLNRHFLAYERNFMSEGERNVLRLVTSQVINLGEESLDFQQKMERVRTCQTFYGFPSTEYVDSTSDPDIESPNSIYDKNSQRVAYFRRYKYQGSTTDKNIDLICTLMRGEGGNFFAVFRKITGGILKVVAPLLGSILGNKSTKRDKIEGLVSDVSGEYRDFALRNGKDFPDLNLVSSSLRLPYVPTTVPKKKKKLVSKCVDCSGCSPSEDSSIPSGVCQSDLDW